MNFYIFQTLIAIVNLLYNLLSDVLLSEIIQNSNIVEKLININYRLRSNFPFGSCYAIHPFSLTSCLSTEHKSRYPSLQQSSTANGVFIIFVANTKRHEHEYLL